MIHLSGVTDSPVLFGATQPLMSDVDLLIPQGRYALLSRTPEFHRAVIDVLTRLRPPRRGFVQHDGRVSWPIGRQGFIRGKATGRRMTEFVCSLYDVEPRAGVALVSDLITNPEYLARPMEHWPLYVRQEFSFALALAPAFDTYVIDGVMPFEPCRFTRLWLALFEERLVGKTLIFSTYRHNQMADYCNRGLVYERSTLRIDADLDACLRQFPARRSRSESADAADEVAIDGLSGGQFGV